MKVRRFSKPAQLSLILLIFSGLVYAQDSGQTKTFKESFSTGENSQLTIDNKYGSVDIHDWDKNSVEIDVLVLVDNVSDERAEKILSYINVEFSQSGDDISAITTFDDKMGKSRTGNHKLEINYTVNMPKDIKLKLSNKYGSVFITELTGHAVIDVKYGKLSAGKLLRGNEKPLTEVNLGYSNADIEEVGWLKSNIKYSTLEIEKSKALIIYSKYSHIFVDEMSSLVSESKYDEFKLGHVSNFVINTEYSNIKINELTKKLDCVTRYTNCTVEHIPSGFESIAVDTKYGGYKLGIDPAASYNLEGYAGYAKISYPDVGRVSRISENNSMKVNGTVGSDENPTSVVKVSTKYAGVRLNY